jgi:hypothetical protein
VSGHPCIKCSCDTVGRRGDLAKVASWRRLGLGEPKVCLLLEGALGRDVNPLGSAALPEAGLGRGEIVSLEWTKP